MAEAELGDDAVLWRWAAFALFYDWRDEGCGLRVLPREALVWIAGDRYRKDLKNTEEVIEYVTERLPDVKVAPHIPARRHRLIVTDGLSPRLFRVVERDRMRSKKEYEERVLFVSGTCWSPKDATVHRKALKALADELLANAPTATSRYVCERLNDRSSRTQSKVLRHACEAREVVRSMRINVAVRRKRDENGDPCESWSEARARAWRQRRYLRRYYHRVLDAIEEQHQQFYAPSKRGRTDRAFALNDGVLSLPKRVRSVLLQDFHEIDLSSAHLRIAASLWKAPGLLAALDDPAFSVWAELADYLGVPLTEKTKQALKEALYSTVYGMSRRGIQAGLSRKLGSRLKGAGRRFLEHPMIAELLEARDRELAAIEQRGFAVTPDRYLYEVTEDADAKSCLASVAQHVEQELMRVVLEYEADESKSDHGRFRVAFWIHDGCYVDADRSLPAHLKRVQAMLDVRAHELGVSAMFELTPAVSSSAPDIAGGSYEAAHPHDTYAPTTSNDKPCERKTAESLRDLPKESTAAITAQGQEASPVGGDAPSGTADRVGVQERTERRPALPSQPRSRSSAAQCAGSAPRSNAVAA